MNKTHPHPDQRHVSGKCEMNILDGIMLALFIIVVDFGSLWLPYVFGLI